MREIKFRAWDKVHKLMYDWDGDYPKFKDELVADDFTDDDLAIMQYTGLKDRHGKEIYEGDIVRFSNNQIHDQTTVVCQWLDFRTGFVYKFLTGQYKGQFTDMTDTWREYEVIGNIFENPEPLED